MNEQQSNRNAADGATLPVSSTSPIRLAQLRRLCNAQFATPAVSRRPLCRSHRSARAALFAAEFNEWQASGGDFLRSSLATSFTPVRRTRGL